MTFGTSSTHVCNLSVSLSVSHNGCEERLHRKGDQFMSMQGENVSHEGKMRTASPLMHVSTPVRAICMSVGAEVPSPVE
eukprot:6467555-Amphidinium_carterae.2